MIHSGHTTAMLSHDTRAPLRRVARTPDAHSSSLSHRPYTAHAVGTISRSSASIPTAVPPPRRASVRSKVSPLAWEVCVWPSVPASACASLLPSPNTPQSLVFISSTSFPTCGGSALAPRPRTRAIRRGLRGGLGSSTSSSRFWW